MSMLPPVIAELKASTSEFTAKMAEARAQMDETAAKADESGSKWGSVTKMAGLAVVAAVGTIGLAVAKMGIEYQASEASLAAHAGISVKAAQAIGNAFLGTAGKSTFSAQQMMAALAPVSGEFVNMYGHALNASQSLRVMSAASDLAEASGQPLADTTKVLADVMLPFGVRTRGAAGAANVLWNASRLLGVPVTDLGKQFQRMTPMIAGSGMSLKQMSGLMVELSHSLGSGRMATRQAGRAIQSLISPSSQANKALGAMGVQLFDAHGKFVGMPTAIARMKSGLDKLPGSAGAVAAQTKVMALQTALATLKGDAQTKSVKAQEKALNQQIAPLKNQAAAFTKSSAMQAIFGRSANAMLAVIAGGPSTFNKYVGAVSQSGKVQSAAEKMSHTFEGRLKVLEATASDLATKLGMVLIPAITAIASGAAIAAQYIGPVLGAAFNLVKGSITAVVGVISGVVSWFNQASIPAMALAVVLTAVLGPALVSLAITAAVSFATMVADAVAGAAAAAAGWVVGIGLMVAQFVVQKAQAAASFAATTAEAVASAAATAAAWVASSVVIVARTIATTAVTVAQYAIQKAAAIATFLMEQAAALGVFIIIAAAVAAFVYIIIKYHKDIEAAAKAVWHAIENAAKAVWDAIKTAISAAVHFVSSLISAEEKGWEAIFHAFLSVVKSIWSDIENAALTAWAAIKTAVSAAISFITSFITIEVHGWEAIFREIVAIVATVWNDIKSDASNLITDITGFFARLPGKIMSELGSLVGDFERLGSSLVHAVLSAFDHIGTDIGGLIKGAVSSIPGVGGLLSHIPGLAAGGIVSKPTLAMVGEAGPEAVVPLAQLAKYTGGIGALPSTLSGASGGSNVPIGQASVTLNVHYNIPVTGDMSPQTAMKVKEMFAMHDRELLAMLRAAR